jgi:circadian clock protein KaiC
VITAESGDGKVTRQGIEEYVADCVILLDHRVEDQTSIRRLRVVKYRGTMHGTSEYPCLIGQIGLSVRPLSSLKLEHKAPTQRVSFGVPSLDTMRAEGFFTVGPASWFRGGRHGKEQSRNLLCSGSLSARGTA